MTYTQIEDPVSRFWSKVEKTETCWVWTKGKDAQGYGAFSFNGKNVRAHRFSYELVHGPTELSVLHHCDNPPCVNPNHLYAGTHSDNMKDAHSRNRMDYSKLPHGDDHWLRQNTDNPNLELVRKGLKEYWNNPDNHVKQSELASEYWADPNNRAIQSELTKNMIKNGVNHHNMKDSKGRFTRKVPD